MVLGKLGTRTLKNGTGPLPYTVCRNQTKRIEDLNVRAQSIKKYQKKTGKVSAGLGNNFLDFTPKKLRKQKQKLTNGITSNEKLHEEGGD
jgi:hypothetical protein